MKINLLILMAFISFNIHAQDTIYIGESGKKNVPRSEAKFYYFVLQDSLNDDIFYENRYYINDTLSGTTTFSNYYSKKKKRLSYRGFHTNGKIRSESFFKKEIIDGYLTTYWDNGNLKRKDLYRRGKFVEGQCWDKTGARVPYFDYEINAKFPGGNDVFNLYVASKIDKNKIPKGSFGSQIRISFFIEEDGSISEIELIEGTDPTTNLMALKMVAEMPKWSPAMKDGDPLRVKRILPIILTAPGR